MYMEKNQLSIRQMQILLFLNRYTCIYKPTNTISCLFILLLYAAPITNFNWKSSMRDKTEYFPSGIPSI